jgi:hypothetical protein
MVDWVTPFARCGGIIEKSAAARSGAMAFNVLNLLMILSSMPACSADLQARQAARIVELDNYTQALEAMVTLLKVASLKPSQPEQATGPAAQASAPHNANAGALRDPSPSSAPADLPVVRLSPSRPSAFAQDEPDSDEVEPALDSTGPASEARATSADQTRPVLKLHGAQEGKVYMRALTATEKDATL